MLPLNGKTREHCSSNSHLHMNQHACSTVLVPLALLLVLLA